MKIFMGLIKRSIKFILPYGLVKIFKRYKDYNRTLNYYISSCKNHERTITSLENNLKNHEQTITSLENNLKNHEQTRKFWLDTSDANMYVEYECSSENIEKILLHIENVWNTYGTGEVYWSVITNKKFERNNINDEIINEFYESGRGTFSQIETTLKRCNEWDNLEKTNCLEYGCGVGRITSYLSKHFKNVVGIDISDGHLKLADEYMIKNGITNIRFERLKSIKQLGKVNKYNFIFSVIVLQHNPPPVIYTILKKLFSMLENNGILMFQVPVKMLGYNFKIDDYLSNMEKYDGMEMHMLPQNVILRLGKENNCSLIEVHNDGWIGDCLNGLSQTFVFKKYI